MLIHGYNDIPSHYPSLIPASHHPSHNFNNRSPHTPTRSELIPISIKLLKRLLGDPVTQRHTLHPSKGKVNLQHAHKSAHRPTPSQNQHTRKEKVKLTPPNTRLAEFSSAATFKSVYVRVITPRASSVTLLLTVTPAPGILSLPPFHARSTAAAAPPKVEWVET
jgi:hypothetical protein